MPQSEIFKRINPNKLRSDARDLIIEAKKKRIIVRFGFNEHEELRIRVYRNEGFIEIGDSIEKLVEVLDASSGFPPKEFETLFFENNKKDLIL